MIEEPCFLRPVVTLGWVTCSEDLKWSRISLCCPEEAKIFHPRQVLNRKYSKLHFFLYDLKVKPLQYRMLTLATLKKIYTSV